MMKRILLLPINCIFFLLSLANCTNKNAGSSPELNNGKLTVVSAIFVPYDFTRVIAGDKVNVKMLLPPAAESHSFEPTPQDIITMQNSDVFIYVGGESDRWAARILDSIDTTKIKILSLMKIVDVVEEEIVEGMDEKDNDDAGPAYDEHVWTSPKNAALIARALAETLSDLDDANSAFYRQNAENYLASLDELDASFRSIVSGAKRKTIIFGDRFPFRYFADAYGLSYFAAFPGCSTETECSAGTLAFLIDKIRAEKIPVVFFIELSNEKIADTLMDETGAKKLLLHSAHNISRRDFDNGVSYLELMKQNAVNLKEALQ